MAGETSASTTAGGLRIGFEVKGLKETLRALNQYGKDCNRELREAARNHAEQVVPVLVASAAGAGPQAMLAAESIRTVSDRVPTISAAGTRRVRPATRPKRKVTAGDVFFGAEFGGGARPTTQQFPPHLGTVGHWFFPALRRATPALLAAYTRTLDELADAYARGGNE